MRNSDSYNSHLGFMFLDEQYFMEFCEGEEKERQKLNRNLNRCIEEARKHFFKKGSRISSNYESAVENWVWTKDLGGTPQCRSAARAVKSQVILELGNWGTGLHCFLCNSYSITSRVVFH